ncbi:MAG: NYN domain-containing protein [bacterium]
MQLSELQGNLYRDTYLFDPVSYGRIFAFVDFANVRHWAKSFWPIENRLFLQKEIDISKVGKVIDTVKPSRKFFYYGYHREHPELSAQHELNKKHRKSWYRIAKAQDCGFSTRQKEIKEINDFDEDGKFVGVRRKCNFDIEMAMDMLRHVEQYDTVFLRSGDSDFHKLLLYLKEKKKKQVITVCARDFVSKEVDECSDLFIPADPFKDILEYVKDTSPGLRQGRA